MKRRSFLRSAGIAGATVSTLPTLINSFTVQALAGGDPRLHAMLEEQDRILVLIQLFGGNDGLNTVVPINNPQYYEGRPTIAIPKNKTLRIHDDLGWHPAMKGFRGLYDQGQLAIVQGVSYPNPDRSHFRGTDIWLTATDADVLGSTGWVGRYLQTLAPGYPTELPAHPLAIQIGTQTSLGLLGSSGTMGISFRDPEEFYRLVNGGGGSAEVPSSEQTDTPAGKEIAFMRNIAKSADVYAQVVKQASDKAGSSTADFPTSDLAGKLKVVSQLISGGLKTRVYLVSWAAASFDTHANQTLTTDPTLGIHANLLTELSEAVSAFMAEMQAKGHHERVAGMTFSEFGRRVAENGSTGTDHGTAAPLFVFGSQVNGGVYGANPNLQDLDAIGDMKMQHDYRDVYASVLLQWFGVPSTQAQQLLYKDFSTTAPSIFKALPTSVEDHQRTSQMFLTVAPNPAAHVVTVRANVAQGSNAVLKLSDMRGKVCGTAILDGWTGVGSIDVSHLSEATYIVTLEDGPRTTHTFVNVSR
ncbi:MAG: DUF1501 domain-containing protein [Ignavibacteria bacterium]|nr:DUF1501 domain-containing protein [Ignavibacteria bacterium]